MLTAYIDLLNFTPILEIQELFLYPLEIPIDILKRGVTDFFVLEKA